ncbi:MAG: two-component system, NarL family, sensor kinase [Cryptosporangiaceae bacterium]|nr:two-component system, NarL family, sensor kinase [Cryptosporangiaceae bacterium]
MPNEDRSGVGRQPRGAVTSAPTTDPAGEAGQDPGGSVDSEPVAGEGADWTVLAEAGHVPQPDRPVSWRRIVVQSVLATIALLSVVAGAGTFAARRAAELESVNDALQVTDLLARAVVIPHLEDALLSADPATAAAAVAKLDPVIRSGVLSGSVVRVKLWSATGRIVYADESRLIGDTFTLDADQRAVLASPRIRGDVSDLKRPENRYEVTERKLLEVYRPVWTPSGKPLLFETYLRYDAVTSRSTQLWRGFAGITISSLLLLVVLQAPLIWALVGRSRRAQRQRELALDRAVSASDAERRRIAATLHDGAVQDLVGSALVVAGAADRARAHGEDELAASLDTAAGTVRASVGGLRSLLVDIYPPSLRDAGLAAALNDLVASVRARDIDVRLRVPSGLELSPRAEAAIFRVAQECLRNAARHSGARTVSVTVTPNSVTSDSVTPESVTSDSGIARLEVADDGCGFDPAAALANPPEGHFGLRLLADLARDSGAALSVASAPGEGTRWRLEVPAG